LSADLFGRSNLILDGGGGDDGDGGGDGDGAALELAGERVMVGVGAYDTGDVTPSIIMFDH